MLNQLLVTGLRKFLGIEPDEDDDVKQFWAASEAVSFVEYDSEEKILMVRYTSGAEYLYFNVSPQKFRRFREAGSKGQFVNFRVKPFYPYGRNN